MLGGIGSHMPIRRTVWYSVDGETRYPLPTVFYDRCDQAVDAAEDYHGNHDGWEDRWPIEIEIFDSEDGPSAGRFEVERESVPQFSAREVR